MFNFTFLMLLKDISKCLIAVIFVSVCVIGFLKISYSSQKKSKSSTESFKEFTQRTFAQPFFHYGIPAIALFFAIYASRLVVVKIVLALCYALLILLLYTRGEKK